MLKRLLPAVAGGMLLAPPALADAPDVSDPDARLIAGFDMPGAFPAAVNAANVNVRPQDGAELDGAGEDVLLIEFPSAGPLAWTSSRANGGDLALSIGPADPNNPLSFPGSEFIDNFQAMNADTSLPIDPSTNDLTTLAWRVGYGTGALLATVRHNGVDDGYFGFTADVGPIHGVAYFTTGFAQGWGFRIEDGVFANGGGSSSDLVMGHAGEAFGFQEAVFNTATSYFPYEQGWTGAWVDGAADGAAVFRSSSESIDESTVTFTAGQADVTLPGVDSASDGMLFVAPSNGSSTTRIASAYPNASGGWTTTVRLEDDADTTGQTFLSDGNDFQFLYVPFDTQNLIGAHVNGSDASLLTSAGNDFFNLTRNSSGEYALSVFGADLATKKTEDDGVLILSNADLVDGSSTLGSRSILSYEYDEVSGDFIIQANELIDIDSATPFDSFGNEFAQTDTDFYFAWVDFANPLSTKLGDFNGNGSVNIIDFGVFADSFGMSGPGLALTGDFDGNAVVDIIDFGNFADSFAADAAAPPAAVPEPGAAALLLASLFACRLVRR